MLLLRKVKMVKGLLLSLEEVVKKRIQPKKDD